MQPKPRSGGLFNTVNGSYVQVQQVQAADQCIPVRPFDDEQPTGSVTNRPFALQVRSQGDRPVAPTGMLECRYFDISAFRYFAISAFCHFGISAIGRFMAFQDQMAASQQAIRG